MIIKTLNFWVIVVNVNLVLNYSKKNQVLSKSFTYAAEFNVAVHEITYTK